MKKESCNRHSWKYKFYDASKYGYSEMRECMDCGMTQKKYVSRTKKKPP